MAATNPVGDGASMDSSSTAQSGVLTLRNIASGAALAVVSGALAYSIALKRGNSADSTAHREAKLGPPVPRQSHEDPEVLKALAATRTSHMKAYDGATAASYVAYHLSDSVFIYPITPSTPLGENCDQWSAAGEINAYGQVTVVKQMQSEAGVAGALHGSLAAGGLSSTFTASQGLLLMIPNMYKIAGELLPCVFHVPARAIAGQALSIFGDHSDIMAIRQTGWAILCASTVQECMDMSLAAHIATLKSRVPFVHFFDGFRTSHEIQKINDMTTEQMELVAKIMAKEIDAHRERALNPNHPTVRGTAQSPDIYFQNVEAANPYYNAVPEHVLNSLEMVEAVTGRHYDLFDYEGDPEATHVFVIMGAGGCTVSETIAYLKTHEPRYKLGLLRVRLLRPWSVSHFLAALPATVKRICVFDHCKESGAIGEPLYVDVCASIQKSKRSDILVIGGRFGLASKNFSPGQVYAAVQNLVDTKVPKSPFTVGIDDDVTNLSLAVPYEIDVANPATTQCMFWGFGSDGTVGANKNAIKIIADNTDLYAQGFFLYDALKSGGVTLSHLRFGPLPIDSPYEITSGCEYVAVHKKEYVNTFDASLILGASKCGSIIVLNAPWLTLNDMEANLPPKFKRLVADKRLKLYVIDANKVAKESGMGRLINNIMQAVFFRLSGALPYEQAMPLFEHAIEKTYKNKGADVVRKNLLAVSNAIDNLNEIDVPYTKWAKCEMKDHEVLRTGEEPSFVRSVLDKIHTRLGDKLSVSAFAPGGVVPLGMTQWAKRGVAQAIPVVDVDKCTQCNKCSAICPHGVIRPFLASPQELASEKTPLTFVTKPATGGNEASGLAFRIQASPLDCTGCEVCVNACPDNALAMKPLPDAIAEGHKDNWDFAMTLENRGDRFDAHTLRGSQFQQPLLEFSGACAGCGETPYAKLLTQMFGKRMLIANATGCSSIWGATAGWVPYTVEKKTGKGPAWGNSLFEDNAEYGMGIAVAQQHRREQLRLRVQEALTDESIVKGELRLVMNQWYENFDDAEASSRFGERVVELLNRAAEEKPLPECLDACRRLSDMFVKSSVWIMGGDGWANDIGYGGIDHVLALNENVNIVVMDTEVYSNTGGQGSKATPMGAVAKFMRNGRDLQKKDIGHLAMSYPNVYVASCSMGANYSQTVRAFHEAEKHVGPSLVLCYSPCIEHRIKGGMTHMSQDQKAAAESGYYPLYRYDPTLIEQGKNPFQLDCKNIKPEALDPFLRNQNRYEQLVRRMPEHAAELQQGLKKYITERHQQLLAASAEVVHAADDLSADSADSDDLLVLMTSTCGDGDMPSAATALWEDMLQMDGSQKLAGRFCVFGLGDSSYDKFCAAAVKLEARVAELGMSSVIPLAKGDDRAEDGWATAFDEWLPKLCEEVGAKPEDEEEPEALFEVTSLPVTAADKSLPYQRIVPPGSQAVPVLENRRLTPESYERDIRHIALDISAADLPFRLGDAITLYPKNLESDVDLLFNEIVTHLDRNEILSVKCLSDDVPARLRSAFKSRIPMKQIFVELLDIFGKPTRSFYRQLARISKSEEDVQVLNSIANSDDRFKELLGRSVSYADVLRRFPKSTESMTLVNFLEIIPLLKPRLYSIANSSFYTPNKVELTIVINRWQNSEGDLKTGTCTRYLGFSNDKTMCVSVASGTFTFPEDEHTPMVMAGLGTGIAPMRAFVQDRMYKKQVLGIETGPMVVFYGCRHEKGRIPLSRGMEEV
ncbi:pyruvate:ferredoxin oxidoreductase/NADPH-cytochrome P450, putative [Perkinsus marinus ATCC 50983]|uniref:Pyruvate:ferredoxin oxidoreductase/NADPH-cytochrome P450, putative n=1 Tax=Perkinsus marinus (strain ATCC 50983 / TXsc) TaxID=423536 RepID=C5LB48_PERM5|nr:pyruvate:ferredoxin oxidoreductase/NADPH-cytochrome P450, putative [Perkinsus marinus ATCC 50983]EER05976.1 pyruvate:ferredoxin oxidoreductase/NADPH-cytochrome P450, putative [Perkinsus marinus ATCC 50983]|eukprot:XP_002774160.1 pyruvate:ferredoxin oxidoreductase/NADPH-cytochrome P450, putative [Perkinsus marinus ATCC 50983]